jgi:hypothetical protein
MFAQLEDHINDQVRRLVNERLLNTNWKRRRMWDTIDPSQIDRFAFMKRVALLCQKGGTLYNKVDGLYDDRCQIAHGQFLTSVNVPTAASSIFALITKLKT